MKSIGGKTFCFCFLWVLFVTAGLFICPKTVFASVSDLVVSEIMYDPAGNDTGHSDWIEIYNTGNSKVSINKNNFGIIDEKDLVLGNDGIHYKNCHGIDDNLEIDSKKFIIIASDKNDFKKDYSSVSMNILDSAFSLSSGGDYIRLSDDKCKTFFADFNFESSWGGKDNGKTLEKIDYNKDYSKNNWQESYVTSGTPGEKNSEKPKPKEYSSKIMLNEILPNPLGDESKDEYIELYNSSNEDVDLEGWKLEDAGTGKYVFPKGTEIKKEDYLVVYRKDFRFAINNSNEIVSLLNPDNVLASRITLGSKSFGSDISYGFDGTGWRRSSFLTPENENKFDKAPNIKIKKDNKIYKKIYANFEVKTEDKDQKVVWDFGDGGSKSYLQKTRHKYLKTGTYQVSLTVKGKSDDFVENFEVEVNKFKESKLKIVKVKANPKGKDAKSESITIKNNSKKKINLKNWSIATGWENLYNHPISKKLIIKPGESKEITKKYSAFTLNNKQTKIELRRPDGSVESKVKYSKKEGVKDDEVYEKTDTGWAWNAPAEAKDTQDNTKITETSVNTAPIGMENTVADTEVVANEQNNVEENVDNNQVEDDSEMQSDEPVENSSQEEILGVETVKENIPDNRNNKNGFFQSILLSANQTINNFINLFF